MRLSPVRGFVGGRTRSPPATEPNRSQADASRGASIAALPFPRAECPRARECVSLRLCCGGVIRAQRTGIGGARRRALFLVYHLPLWICQARARRLLFPSSNV